MFTGMLLAFLLAPSAAEGGFARPGFDFFEPVHPPRALQVMAHRGAMRQAPENTAPALDRSIADTVELDEVEVDVRLSQGWTSMFDYSSDDQNLVIFSDALGSHERIEVLPAGVVTSTAMASI